MTDHRPDPRKPEGDCDLVMKGGIASGVVYPPAILALAQRYRFRNIGGTSAGAIGAALAAAAEMGREQGSLDPDGANPQSLEARQKQVRENDKFVRNLFQPEPAVAPLFNTLLDLLTSKPPQPDKTSRPLFPGYLTFLPKLTRAFALNDWWFFLPVLVVSVIVWWLLLNAGLPVGIRGLGALFLGWVTAIVLGMGHLYYILQFPVRENFHGICTGRTVKGQRQEALTDWMHTTLEQLAGHTNADAPLTFAELTARTVNGKQESINLQMVATNLSHNQPYILPFHVNGFLFKEDELRRLFPDTVVDYMKGTIPAQSKAHDLLRDRPWLPATAPVSLARLDGTPVDTILQVSLAKLNEQLGPGNGFYFLPPGDALPVLVAMRMSLSFPLMFSAVPLWTISMSVFKEKDTAPNPIYDLELADLQRHWFIDGGVASNFPIHFFDAWVPRWPTFAIDLTPYPKEAFVRPELPKEPRPMEQALGQLAQRMGGSEYHPPSISVLNLVSSAQMQAKGILGASPAEAAMAAAEALQEMVQEGRDVFLLGPTEEMAPVWQDITSLGGLIGAIKATMQDYRDNTQAMLPSYRERIVHIRLDDQKGEGGMNLNMPLATIKRIDRKGRKAGELLIRDFDFDEHRWIRFRVLMAELEEQLKRMRDLLTEEPNQPASTNGTLSAGSSAMEPAPGDAVALVGAAVESASQAVALYAQMIQDNDSYPYPLEDNDLEEAFTRLKGLFDYLQTWGGRNTKLFGKNPPLPKPVLRVTPDL